MRQKGDKMYIGNESKAYNILNEIHNIIWNDNLSDEEALERIELIIKQYNLNKKFETGDNNLQ